MNFDIECEREDDGRWLAEVPQWLGVSACSTTCEAMVEVQRQDELVFAFDDRHEIGPKMLARVAKRTGLTRQDSTL